MGKHECTAPPANPVRWRARSKRGTGNATIVARTWFAARAEACRLIGCAPEEVDVVLEVAS